jgi:RNA polymerase sigma factor for flagellar operon FliA
VNSSLNIELWSEYSRSHDTQIRNRLIEHYSYLVEVTSRRLIGIERATDREDIISAGMTGLIKAIDQFDMTRPMKFESYAIALVRGAMLDMLRGEDWVPRSMRVRQQSLQTMYMQLESSLGRPATDDEVAAALNLEPEQFRKLLAETGEPSPLSLNEMLSRAVGDEDAPELTALQDYDSDPSLLTEIRERRLMLARAIDQLPAREQQVIALYYHEGMTFKEIGKVFSMSESRVYQLHTQAVTRLRGYLKRDDELFR